MEFETTGASLDQDARNYRTDDQHEKAAVDAVLAIAGRQLFDNGQVLTVSADASEDGVSVTVLKA